jgi:hypothetical protein
MWRPLSRSGESDRSISRQSLGSHENKRNREMKNWSTQNTTPAEGAQLRRAWGLYRLGCRTAKMTTANPQAMRGPA